MSRMRNAVVAAAVSTIAFAGCAAGVSPARDLGGLYTWSSITFLFSDHLALTQDLGFADNLLFRPLDSPRRAPPDHAARTRP